jgi:cation diffusion facilitator family transporter
MRTFTNEKKAIALSSVGAAVLLAGTKLTVGLATNSLGILSEAAHSGLDLLAALITYVAVSVSDKPADEDHRYGHGKMENLSALFETILLLITCGWIIWEAIHRLSRGGVHVEANVWSFAVVGLAIIVDISRSRALKRVARKYNSQALEADALHFASDIWSSLTVLAGLLFVSIGRPSFDSIAAIGVAFLVLFVSYRLGRRTIDALMDRVPAGLSKTVESIVRAVEGVDEVRSVRLRTSGAKLFIDMTIAIKRTITFERAHRIMDEVERAVDAFRPDADLVVHAEPIRGKDESIVDKVRMIVLNKGLRAPHNLEVYRSGSKHFIDFDVEYKIGHTFLEAHGLATEIEEQIREEVPTVEKVTIHLEEYHPGERELVDATQSEQELVDKIKAVALRDTRVAACTDVTILKRGGQYHLTFTCQFDKSRTLAEVHEIISEVEGLLYQQFPQLYRITVHAEPTEGRERTAG